MRNLLDELQACPPFRILPFTADSMILSIFAFSVITNASFPPSSRTLGLRYSPARAPTALHAVSDPVRLTPRMSGLAIMCSLSRDDTNTFV